jgi:hypothetical protein
MSTLSKQQLGVANQTSFPNNTTGYISPSLLRGFNTDIIDSTVNQTGYNTDSSSVSAQLVGLNLYTQSLNTNFITSGSLNAATASLSASLTTTINTKLPTSTFIAYTASTNARLDFLEVKVPYLSQSNTFEMDNTFEQQVFIGEDLNVVGKISVTGSIVGGDITGSKLNITDNSVLGRNIGCTTLVNGTLSTDILIIDGENFEEFSASVVFLLNSSSAFPAYSTSVDSRLDSLEAFSSSLDITYATDAQLAAVSVSLNLAKLDTSSFNSYSASAFSQSIFVSQSFSSSLSSVSQSCSSSLSSVSQSVSGTINILSTSVDSRLNTIEVRYATTGSNTFVGNQTITGVVSISSSATYDLDITGAFQATGASRISSSVSINSLTPTFSQISSSTGTSILSRGYLSAGMSTNQIALFSSGSTSIGSFNNAPAGIAGIAINSGSALNQWYYPIQFEPSTNYTDGRVTITTPLVVSSSVFVSGSITITGSSNSNVVAITPASNTASIDMSKGNFFTLTIPSSSITLIRATNIKEGQTVGIKLLQQSTTGSVRFDTPFKFWSGSAQYNTGSTVSNAVDLYTFMTFDTASLYTSAIKNLV